MSRYKMIHPFLLLLVAMKLPVHAEEREQYKPLPGYSFVYVSDDRKAQVPEISDSLFNASAKGIRFDVNSVKLRQNEPFIRLYLKEIAPYSARKGWYSARLSSRVPPVPKDLTTTTAGWV